ncbi:Uu.00g107600.m01.CDS01 [Anthostomella pinea]|uniref:Uu.00g107600.m01.CDS01 n=1 Tax=Anthostomella pinea TaxID=933095 RepID=A0AAI8VE83_9PEZI|nr:Uu.00g107600.m01.CDS01 [Anthostomella pinea]
MSKIIDDVKTGLKGVRGAGDAVRGGLMDATDQAFDNNSNHPQTQASQQKNQAIAEKGRQDVRGVDDMMARREWEREDAKAAHHGAGVDTAATAQGATISGQQPAHAPNASSTGTTGHGLP